MIVDNYSKINQVLGEQMGAACKKKERGDHYLLYISQIALEKITTSPVSMKDFNSFMQAENILKTNVLIWLVNEENKTSLIINPNAKKLLKNDITLHINLYQNIGMGIRAKNQSGETVMLDSVNLNLKGKDIEFECSLNQNQIIEMNGAEEKDIREFYSEFIGNNFKEFKEKTFNMLQEHKKNNKETEKQKNEKSCITF